VYRRSGYKIEEFVRRKILMKAPVRWSLKGLLRHINECQAEINGKWVPARTIGVGTLKNRVKLAWLVLIGRADILIWPEGQ